MEILLHVMRKWEDVEASKIPLHLRASWVVVLWQIKLFAVYVCAVILWVGQHAIGALPSNIGVLPLSITFSQKEKEKVRISYSLNFSLFWPIS